MNRSGRLNVGVAVDLFRKHFGYGDAEKVSHVASCLLKTSMRSRGFFGGNSNYRGLLYGSTNYLTFYSITQKKVLKKVSLKSVSAIRPGLDYNGIQIETGSQKLYFVEFKNRDASMGKFMKAWSARTSQEQEGPALQVGVKDPLLGAILGVGSSKTVTIRGSDVKKAANFARRHADKIDVQVAQNGGVSVGIKTGSSSSQGGVRASASSKPPPQSQADSKASEKRVKKPRAGGDAPWEDDWTLIGGKKRGGRPKEYLCMSGHTGLQSQRMGVYEEVRVRDGYPIYKHSKGGWYLYYYKKNNFWFVGSKVGKRSGWLYAESGERRPYRITATWRFWDDKTKAWAADDDILCVKTNPDDRGEEKGSRSGSPAPNGHAPESKQEVVDDLAEDFDSIFNKTSLEGSWFAALFELYGTCGRHEQAVKVAADKE